MEIFLVQISCSGKRPKVDDMVLFGGGCGENYGGGGGEEKAACGWKSYKILYKILHIYGCFGSFRHGLHGSHGCFEVGVMRPRPYPRPYKGWGTLGWGLRRSLRWDGSLRLEIQQNLFQNPSKFGWLRGTLGWSMLHIYFCMILIQDFV